MRSRDDTTTCTIARADGPGRSALRRRPGFTLAELLVAVLIIGVLISLILVAINAGSSGARRQAERATVSSIAQAVRQFEQTFGFPPPLVQDGLQGTGGAMAVEPAVLDRAGAVASGTPVEVVPINPRVRMVVTYNPAFEPNRRFLEGLDPLGAGAPALDDLVDRYDPEDEQWLIANQRYSKYSLGIYLTGALPASVDGVEGPGMVRPLADGTFEGTTANSEDEFETLGRSTARDRFEPFFDADSRAATLRREYIDVQEYRENAGDPGLELATPADETDWRHVAIVDENGRAYRYYRWEPLSSAYGIDVTATHLLNIPSVLLDEAAMQRLVGADEEDRAAIDLTGGDAQLRGARWAVVGAGRDGLFGTEPIETLREALRLPAADFDDFEVRARAKEDNVVEVGR